jgi:predicted  nucleic acid-binding Zn-ribbon protein
MSLEAQIEELRAELKASVDKREIRQIARELQALTEQKVALSAAQ